MTAAKFDWNKLDDACIVQQQVEKVAIYSNPSGDIVIRQELGFYDESDTFIVIARGNVPTFIAKMREAAELDIEETATRSKDISAAERQRRRRAKQRDGRDNDRDSVTAQEPLRLVAAE